jgi:TPR repeat protein
MLNRLFAVLLFSVLAAAPAQAGFEEGKTFYDKGNWIQAIINLRPLVEAGDARAMILLGNMYLDGHGVAADETEAFGLYHQAAEKGNTDGMVAIAALYQTGKGVPENTPLAIGWFERAARLGNQTAQFMYAIHLYQGSKGAAYDIKADHPASYKWFRIATGGPNKKLGNLAKITAERMMTKLANDDIVKGDRESANWKPEMPETLGPDPEEKMVAAMKEKEAQKQGQPQSGAPAPQAQKPDDKPPAPEKK